MAATGADRWNRVGRRDRLKLVRTEPAGVQRALEQLRRDPRVEYAEPNYLVAADETIPNDPEFSRLWGLRNTGASGGTADADIDADEAWDTTTGSADMLVAVIDTGIDFGHPDLAAAQWTNPGETGGGKESNGIDDDGNGYVDDWRGWDFVNDDNNPYDDHGHGTHVAGTIGAVGDNGVGVVGVSWNVRLMGLKFLSADGWGTTADAVEAIRYATEMGAVATNNSWGGGGYSQALLEAIEDAGNADSLFVAAAGNDGEDTDVAPHYPSSYDLANVVSVAATTRTDARASFSNFGRRSVDLGAPGAQIYSTVPGGGYDTYSGTSMATPHVAGAAALAKAAFPAATALGLKALLLRTVDGIGSMSGIVASGGRLNAGRAVGCSAAPQVWIESPADGFVAVGSEPVEVAVLAGVCGVPGGIDVTATAAGAPVTLTAGGNGLYTGSFVPPAGGDVTLVVSATAGGATDTRTVSAEVDATAPSVALTSPADGLVAGGTVTLAAQASDSGGVARVDFLIDGAVVGSDTTLPYSLGWDSTSGPDGTRSIAARAVDLAGNAAATASTSLDVDNTPPLVSFAGGFAFTSSEPGSSFQCSLDGEAFSACVSPWTPGTLAAGAHSLAVRAIDAAGNVGPAAVLSWTVEASTAPAPAGGGGGGGGVGSADLALVGHAQPAEVALGSTVTLFLRVLDDKNYGPAPGVGVELELPGSLVPVFTYADRGPGCTQPEAGRLRCELDWLSSDAPYGNVTVRLLATATGEAVVGARVAYASADPYPADNSLELRITVPEQAVAEPKAKRTKAARLARATVARRRITLRLVARRPTVARIVVTRRGKPAIRARRKLRRGVNVVRLVVPRHLPATGYRVIVRLGDGTKLSAPISARHLGGGSCGAGAGCPAAR